MTHVSWICKGGPDKDSERQVATHHRCLFSDVAEAEFFQDDLGQDAGGCGGTYVS